MSKEIVDRFCGYCGVMFLNVPMCWFMKHLNECEADCATTNNREGTITT